MPSTFFGLNIGVSGVHAYNTALNTTSHNIANLGTTGYSRQIIKQHASDPFSVGGSYGMLGTGTLVTDIQSTRDVYYDMKYRSNNSTLGKYSTESYYLKNIENFLWIVDEENSTGMTADFNSFFANMLGASAGVEETDRRIQAIISASTFGASMRDLATQLQGLQQELNNEIKTMVDAINSYAKEIASLTKQINTLEAYGGTANDLRDRRATMLDELSEIVHVDANEYPPAEGEGLNQFIVSIGGALLVDTYNYNTLELVTNRTSVNQNDADGLYSIKWSNGQDFSTHGSNLGGILQGLFALRDGNNKENFKATITEVQQYNQAYDNRSTITLTSSDVSGANVTDLNLLDIPATKGRITVSNMELSYDSFDVTINADGTYTYTFVLTDDLKDSRLNRIESFVANGVTGRIGEEVNFKGVPYYMAQLNQFVRVFSASFNEVHNQGYDLTGNKGVDMFTGLHPTQGTDMDFNEYILHSSDKHYYLNGYKIVSQNEFMDYTLNYTLQADTAAGAGYFQVLNDDGEVVEQILLPQSSKIFSFSSVNKEGDKVSYYSMTALNFSVSRYMENNPESLALASEDPLSAGVAQYGNLNRLLDLKEDKTMFKEGKPLSFLQVMVTKAGVEAKKVNDLASNAEDIVESIDHTRQSISGVDEDEEAADMIRIQNLLNYQYHVISVMNQVLDKLINQTAI